MQPYVGWALLFASVTCMQGYIRWDLFVLGAQPLDTSPLSLCWHNKMLLPSKLPQCTLSQLEIPATFLRGSLLGLWKWWFVTSLVTRVHPPDCQEKIPLSTKGQLDLEEGFVLLGSWDEGLRCTMEPGEV
jgi:hypothetical protein